MEINQWNSYREIRKDKYFKGCFNKLILGDKSLSYNERSYLLAVSILFFEAYRSDRRYTSYADLAYSIVLNYSLLFDDYKPLYDFSINFGFFPISNSLSKFNFIETSTISGIIGEKFISNFHQSDEGYIGTYEQTKRSKELLESSFNTNCYVAPTSFGKSSLIIDYIKRDKLNSTCKVAIIVPTKSLLQQTYRLVKKANLGKRILLHDEMYNDDETFIAIFTQERALRLMNRRNVFYDILIIDEAHKVLESDDFFKKGQESIRSILLARLIKRNKTINSNLKLLYLSPLIEDSNTLMFDNSDVIKSHRLKFNLKVPTLIEYWELRKSSFLYERFLNTFHKIAEESDYNDFLKNSIREKNFFFTNTPVKVEELALLLQDKLPDVIDPEIIQIQKVLKNEVHIDFNAISLLGKGIVYLHAKIPDFIKDYLEDKFRNVQSLKYLVANSVVLEGINMPVDTLFIHDSSSLSVKGLINLIGRVNRLNMIFNEDYARLDKLRPSIYFVDNDLKEKKQSKHRDKIKRMRSFQDKDIIKNPILEKFNKEDLTQSEKNNYDSAYSKLQIYEQLLARNISNLNDKEKILLNFINADIVYMYYDIDKLVDNFYFKLNNELYKRKASLILESSHSKFIESKPQEENNKIVSLIYLYFIKGEEKNIKDKEFLRLQNGSARNVYWYLIYVALSQSYKERIKNTLNRIYKDESTMRDDNLFYIGKSRTTFLEQDYEQRGPDVYVDLRKTSHKEKVNIAIAKEKVEEDFISFKLSKFISLLLDLNIVPKEEYNKSVYGTNNEVEISLAKFGFTPNLIRLIREHKQLDNIEFDKIGNIEIKNKDNFDLFLQTLNELDRFQIQKLI